MRQTPSMNYSPNTPKYSNMTLYEMAESMSETGDAQEAFPYLVKWLLKDFWSNYKYNNSPYSEEYAYNIAYFTVYNFLNREICNKKPEVFRTKYLKEIVNMNLESDFYAILKDLKDATVDLYKNIDFNETDAHKLDATLTNDLTETTDSTSNATSNIVNNSNSKEDNTTTVTNNLTETSDGTSNLKNNTTNSSSADSSNNNVVTNDLKKSVSDIGTDTTTYDTTTQSSSSNTNDGTKRDVLTDYPQSTVNTTTVGSWNYASGANDTTTHDSGSSTGTDTKTGTDKLDINRTRNIKDTGTIDTTGSSSMNSEGSSDSESDATSNVTVKKTGTVTTVEDNTNKSDSTTDSTSDEETNIENRKTGTVKNQETKDIDKDAQTKIKWQGLTGLELNSKQLELYNKYGSFYKTLLRRLENCFISVYIDPERDGWLEPSVNLLSVW